MRFHVIGLPHTQTTKKFSSCAFTTDVMNFCKMMKAEGHTVYLYSGDRNEAPCDHHIACFSEEERLVDLSGKHYTNATFDYNGAFWRRVNGKAIDAIREKAEPHDFICVIGGLAHKQIADAFPNMITVEFAIGYGGTFAKYRVWKSYAWMNICYGCASPRNPHAVDGGWCDEMIPGYLNPADFPFRERADEDDPYYLFIGRLIERKGINVAVEACKKLDLKLVIAGAGTPPDYGEYVGVVDPEQRAKLMGGAKAVFMPTIFPEPFGMVAIESMACGTPVITTDWGAFPETVKNGRDGYRCKSLKEFCWAAEHAPLLDRSEIANQARNRYSLDTIAPRYVTYFERIGDTVWGDDFAGRSNQRKSDC